MADRTGNDGLDRRRMDASGRAYAGSQRRLQTYVNERPEQLSAAMLSCLHLDVSAAHIEWISPLARNNYAEYKDADFLSALGLHTMRNKMAEFWPNSGPRWDGLARFPTGTGFHYIFIEAKSHVPEMYSSGCGARSPRSLNKIVKALNETKIWLRVPPEGNWTGPLYQSANRLAHLYWFREVVGLHAAMVNVYFLGDPHSPTTMDEWKSGISKAKTSLRISGVEIPGLVELFLPALD